MCICHGPWEYEYITLETFNIYGFVLVSGVYCLCVGFISLGLVHVSMTCMPFTYGAFKKYFNNKVWLVLTYKFILMRALRTLAV